MLRTLLLLVLLLPGCMSIPVSTMLRMRDFDQNAFVALVPADIRVRVKVPDGFAIDPAQTVLRIALSTDDGGSVMGSFPLAVIAEDLETLPGGVFSDELQLRRYELRLSPRGLELFAQAQDQLRSARAGEFKLDVSWAFAHIPEKAESARFWIALKLAAGEDYFALIEDAQVAFGRP